MKLRKGLKPAILHDLDDLYFEIDNIKYSQTNDKMPFMKQYCRDPEGKFLFFAAPKPFKQVNIIHPCTSNSHMLPCA